MGFGSVPLGVLVGFGFVPLALVGVGFSLHGFGFRFLGLLGGFNYSSHLSPHCTANVLMVMVVATMMVIIFFILL